jgi:hypothetical protein
METPGKKGEPEAGKKNLDKPAKPVRPPDVNAMAGLLLGSPEFQRR